MLIRGLGEERERAEKEVSDAGVLLGLSHRAVWAKYVYHGEPWFLLVRDLSGRACAGVAIEKVHTRALPGHAILRVGKFGGGLPGEVCKIALQGLTRVARNKPRVLWLQLNLFSREGNGEITDTLNDLGYQEVRPPSSYRHTLVIDLKPAEEEIFAALGKSARKRIKETMKMSLRSVAIEDPVYAGRLKELQLEALRRTGGHSPSEDWRRILKMSQEYPNSSRVFGLFLGDDTAPESMGAFGWVCNHGDHGEYRAAGSQRRSDVRIPFSYLLLWDMIRWSKETGAEWFDMGGVTLSDGEEPALKGISEFKRHFSREVVEVGSERILNVAPARARIVMTVSNSASRLRGWWR